MGYILLVVLIGWSVYGVWNYPTPRTFTEFVKSGPVFWGKKIYQAIVTK